MPAKSKSQQRLLGQAYAYDKGDLRLKDIPEGIRDKVKDIADSMKSKDLSDFAHTKTKDLPERVTFIIDKIMKEARHETDTNKRWICPKCHKPTVREGYLGWRDCKKCGWEEKHPEDLKEAE